MMIHVLSGEWPIPEEPVQVNPNNPDDLIAISEFDRRKDSHKNIINDHPLMGLIRRCLSNSSSHRPTSSDVHQQVSKVAEKYLSSYANRVEMLNRIKALETEMETVNAENSQLRMEKDALSNEKEELSSQLESHQTTSLSTSVSHSTELEMMQAAMSDYKSEIKHLQDLLELKTVELSEAEKQHGTEVSALKQQIEAEKEALEDEHQSNMQSTLHRTNSEKSALEAELEKLKRESKKWRVSQSAALEESHKLSLQTIEEKHQLQLETKVKELASKDAMLAEKSKTNETLRDQLKQTLATTNQAVGSKQVSGMC